MATPSQFAANGEGPETRYCGSSVGAGGGGGRGGVGGREAPEPRYCGWRVAVGGGGGGGGVAGGEVAQELLAPPPQAATNSGSTAIAGASFITSLLGSWPRSCPRSAHGKVAHIADWRAD